MVHLWRKRPSSPPRLLHASVVSRFKEESVGGEGRDNMSGDDGNDRIVGGAGSDVTTGDGGNDRLSGGAGNDRLFGRAGIDFADGGGGSSDVCRAERTVRCP